MIGTIKKRQKTKAQNLTNRKMELKKKTKDGIVYTMKARELFEGSEWLNDLYTAAPDHIAGETIQVPSWLQTRGAPRYYTGQTSPAELSAHYAMQGRENPSREAYESLQNELAHYIEADTAALEVKAVKSGIILGTVHGVCFDYSPGTGYTIEDQAGHLAADYWQELFEEAQNEALEALEALASC
jgi:hypothetical protein